MRCFTLFAVTLALTDCGGPAKPPPDAGLIVDAGAPPDAGPRPDAGAVVCTQFLDRGYCFEHSAACVDDAGCGLDTRGCSQTTLRCQMQTDRDCVCWGNGNCPTDSFCLSNEQVCGQCMQTRPTCQTWVDCPTGNACVGGICSQPCCH